MQTFLPSSNFITASQMLDSKRLNKQILEGYQILNVLSGQSPTGAWRNHPAVRMWAGHELSLLTYIRAMIAEAKRTDAGISVRVAPMMLDRSHPLASVREAFNAVFVEAESAGELMFYGRGAGGQPTASAILGDVVAVSRHIALNSIGQRETSSANTIATSSCPPKTMRKFHQKLGPAVA